jgi:thymidylate synthase (FAD)
MSEGPSLYIVARPQLDNTAIEEFLASEDVSWRRTSPVAPAEEIVELAGRVCYMSFGQRQSQRSTDEYIANLIDQGHESVLEHASWGFILTGVTRAFSHQLVRHRIGFSYSQLSQQYHDEGSTEAIIPEVIRHNPTAAHAWRRAVEQSRRTYRELLRLVTESEIHEPERERARQLRSAARSVLPAAIETKLFVTANGRAIRHFLAERGAILGDEEMRIVSALFFSAMEIEAPHLVADFEQLKMDDGLPLVRRRDSSKDAGADVAQCLGETEHGMR